MNIFLYAVSQNGVCYYIIYYRDASVTEKTNHLNCIFTKEVFAAPHIITNSAFLTNFNVFNAMFQLSVLILSWCTTCTSDSQLWTKFHWSKAYYIVHSSSELWTLQTLLEETCYFSWQNDQQCSGQSTVAHLAPPYLPSNPPVWEAELGARNLFHEIIYFTSCLSATGTYYMFTTVFKLRHVINHLPPTSTKVKERVKLPLLPLWTFMEGNRMKFTFYRCQSNKQCVHISSTWQLSQSLGYEIWLPVTYEWDRYMSPLI
jgi:hypothetical protein